jgi:hypothetical protein
MGHRARGVKSALGHERTFADVRVTSAFPLIADTKRTFSYVRSGPEPDYRQLRAFSDC